MIRTDCSTPVNAEHIFNLTGTRLARENWRNQKFDFSGGKTSGVDGPFTESKELIAGFWLILAKSKDEAVAWMRCAPF